MGVHPAPIHQLLLRSRILSIRKPVIQLGMAGSLFRKGGLLSPQETGLRAANKISGN